VSEGFKGPQKVLGNVHLVLRDGLFKRFEHLLFEWAQASDSAIPTGSVPENLLSSGTNYGHALRPTVCIPPRQWRP
jgi:hypothetical protein